MSENNQLCHAWKQVSFFYEQTSGWVVAPLCDFTKSIFFFKVYVLAHAFLSKTSSGLYLMCF